MAENKKKKVKLRIKRNPLQSVPDEEIGRFVDEAIERIDLDRPVAENVKPNVTQPHSLLKMHRWNQLGEYIAPKAEFPTMREARRLAGRVGARLFGGPAALRQTIENQRLAEIARIDRAKAIAAARAERGAMYRQALGGRLSRKATAKALGTATVRGIPRSLGLIGRVALGPIGMGLGSALDYYEVGRQIAARGDLKEAQEHIREQGKGLEEKGFRVLQRRTGDVEIAEPGELPEWAENLPDSDLIRMVRKKRQMLQLERELEMRRDAREKKLKAIAQQRKEIPQQRALRR